MRIQAWVCRSVWSAVLFGSLLVACGGAESAEAEAVFEPLAPDREVHAASVSCPSLSNYPWSQSQPAWNSNWNTAGTYHCSASVPARSSGSYAVVFPSNWERDGFAQLYCNNGTWQWSAGRCDGGVVSTAISVVCSDSDPVRSMWVGWYLADLKRCADAAGLNWWVSQYNNNTYCTASNNYDGYGDRNVCWRERFRAAANNNGNSYNEAQATGHIASGDEYNMCGSRASYPWASVSSYGMYCKYKP